MSRATVDALQSQILAPYFKGYRQLDEHLDSAATSARCAAVLQKSDGKKHYLSVVAWRAPDGAFASLGSLLIGAWTLDAQSIGFDRLDQRAVAKLALAGMARDRRKLESLSVTGMNCDDGAFRTWDNAAAYYQAIAQQSEG